MVHQVDNWLDLKFFGDDGEFANLVAFVKRERKRTTVHPSDEQIYRALELTPLDEVKVVILGQDPYPTPGHANGLAFSVSKDVKPLPYSLQNIYKELSADVGRTRLNGDLTDWAEQGVLLLNTSLTVVSGRPASHADVGWFFLVDEAIKTLNEQKNNLVFMLWGRHAQMRGKKISRYKHCVIECAHPSPLSANNGFFGSKCFSRANQYLAANNIKTIYW